MPTRILYEDNHIISVYKPAGLLVQGDESGDPTLMDEVKKYLKDKYKKPGNVFLGLVHRLDRNVSGIVLFAKTSKGASRLSEQFRNNEIKKIYTAVVEGRIRPPSGRLSSYLRKDANRKVAVVSDLAKKDHDESELYYETMRSNKNCALLKIELKTGRFHQIRAQLSHAGYPIVGDIKYGFKNKDLRFKNSGELALCATEIRFKTATTEEFKTIKIDYPAEWDLMLK